MTENDGLDRRSALKKVAAAAGVATVVWAEPSIKGLARRPAYATNASAGVASLPGVVITGTIDPVTGEISAITSSPDISPFELDSNPTALNRPRLRLRWRPGMSSMVSFSNLTNTSGPEGEILMPNDRNIGFDSGASGPFMLTVDVICDPE